MPLRLSAAEAARMGLSAPSQPSSKYRNVRTTVGPDTFDSAMEAARWRELLLLVRSGQIRDLQRQVRFELAPSVQLAPGRRKTRPMVYVADFVYVDAGSGQRVVEDVKGAKTRPYLMKRHLMKTVLNIDIVEVTARR